VAIKDYALLSLSLGISLTLICLLPLWTAAGPKGKAGCRQVVSMYFSTASRDFPSGTDAVCS